MVRPTVQIQGDGIAGRCCARLLSQAGFAVAIETAARPRVPVIMLSEPAQNLIAEIFELRNPFHNLPHIRRRIVSWGGGAEPVSAEHSAVVISEEDLLARVGIVQNREAEAGADPLWKICSAKPLPAEAAEHRFGSRFAVTMPVDLKKDALTDTCWMEALGEGWLFLVANAPGAGWLVAAGAHLERLIEGSSLVRNQIERAGNATAAFAVSPRLADPLGAPGWLACGSAAIGFDPICGDGSAHAVREAILACAVIKAAEGASEKIEPLLEHYQNRLTAGFLRHLLHCLQYYSTGGDASWWREEASATRRGIEWCSRRIGGDPKFRYRLNGFELEAVS